MLAYLLFFRIRVWGVERVPRQGGFILASNHASFLDPPAVGVALARQVRFFARRSLFDVPLVGRLIASWRAVPISRGASDIAAIRQAVDVLRRGQGIVLFPEGTRSNDGRVGEFRPGFVAVAARARVPIVPVAVHGAFAAWPRTRRLPRAGRIHVAYGEPIAPPTGGKADYLAVARHTRECVVALKEGLELNKD